jgi:hypothetical protein
MSTDMNQNKDNLEWLRNKVQELASQGYNQSEISWRSPLNCFFKYLELLLPSMNQ